MSLKADYILYSDAIFDSVKSEPFAGAVAIAGDKIVYAGEKKQGRLSSSDRIQK